MRQYVTKLLIFIFQFLLLTSCLLFSNVVSANTPAAVATFAGGCFWCMQPPYDKLKGVKKTIVGYTGGHVKNPSYSQVSKGDTGHYEAVQVIYNPKVISYKRLLTVFWHNIDPTDGKGQFCDRGSSYRSAIFYHNSEQKRLAEASKEKLLASGRFKHIATKILPASKFYPAERYHQNYYKKNSLRYRYYRYRCGRDDRLRELWGKKAKH